MTAEREVSEQVETSSSAVDRFRLLVDEKAWEHLGVTGEEFR